MTNGTEDYGNILPLKRRGYPGEDPQDWRNEQVCEAFRAGTPIAQIARDIGRSPTRVRQILDRRGLRVKAAPPTKAAGKPAATKPIPERVEKPSAYGPSVRKKSTKVCTRCGREFTWIDTPMGWKQGDEYIPESKYDPATPYPHWEDSDGTRWLRHDCAGRNW